ncbi:ABC transporter ATP-binding protein [Salinisphaera sp. LB1]|uniref:ABC transporter ATP-binding protein n=1 Tax=Salinisphaera sp. LB1 TaxID=2183911 RepID=UPI000D705194|nr:ABC transporter ATP-binding protein [Salinisphaera sp. LB1]AWN17836.1 Lipid A export ATP-binding/permease protein MsbA [Salinisphaera sp. LB1]
MFQFFERLVDPFPDDDRTPPETSIPRFIAFYARPVWKLLIATAVLTAASSIIEVSLYGFLGHIVDWFSTSDRAHFIADNAWPLVGMAIVVLVLLPALVFGQGLTTFQAMAPNVPMRFRWQVHRWLLDQSLTYFQDDFAGRIASKMMQTALAIREVMMKFVDVLLYVAVYFGGVVVMVAGADWRLALPFGGWLVGYIALLRYFLPRLQSIAEAQANARAEMTGRVVDAYTNIGTVKLFAHTERESDYARASMSSFLSTVYTQMRRINGFYASLYLLNALLLFAVTGLGIVFWSERAITAGAVATAVGLVLQINGMSQWIMWEVSNLFEHIGTIRDGMGSFTRNRAIVDAPDARPLQVADGATAFEDISFHYGRDDAGIISNFSLSIAPGEKIGLVGRSGAGKSTLLALLLRFHELENGRITIDGQDITGVTQASLREAIGMVTQDTALLHRSIADNIRYGRPDATEAELWAAIDAAHAGFVYDLTDNKGRRGLDAHVGERGVKLSGGQRQRVALARVMLKNAPILLLDEATAALDSEIEAAITENLHTIMQGKTVIAVAHRLSTIAELDRLVVIDRGAIVETGTHDQLIAHNGLYARLWAMQSGGFLGAASGVSAENAMR